MASSSCLPGPLALQNRTLSLFPSHFQQLTHFRLSFQPKEGPKIRSYSSSPRVSCLRESKAAVVTEKSWDQLILKSEIPVLVEFHASWCGPCRMVHRVVDEIATEYSGRLKCFVLHADTDMQVAENYDIKAVPVVLLFKHGMRCDCIVGTMPKEFYVAAIERVLAL